MSRSRITPALLLLALCASCSGSDRPGDAPAHADPVISAPALDVLLTGLPFQLQLEATVAAPPAAWAFDPAPPSSLSWLSLSADGLLSGTPPALLTPAARVTVRVTDAAMRTATVSFPVEVRGCDPAVTPSRTCYVPAAGACSYGVATCTGGAFGDCTGGSSTDAGHCGAACGPCGAGADRCYGGDTCRCGSGAACTGAHTTSFSCTAGACVNACASGYADCNADPQDGCEAALTTLANCGACGNACTPPTNGTVECRGGACAPSCPARMIVSGAACVCDTGLTPCGSATTCVDLLTDASNCGACGNACTAANGGTTCSGGTCTSVSSCPIGTVPCGTGCTPRGTICLDPPNPPGSTAIRAP